MKKERREKTFMLRGGYELVDSIRGVLLSKERFGFGFGFGFGLGLGLGLGLWLGLELGLES